MAPLVNAVQFAAICSPLLFTYGWVEWFNRWDALVVESESQALYVPERFPHLTACSWQIQSAAANPVLWPEHSGIQLFKLPVSIVCVTKIILAFA